MRNTVPVFRSVKDICFTLTKKKAAHYCSLHILKTLLFDSKSSNNALHLFRLRLKTLVFSPLVRRKQTIIVNYKRKCMPLIAFEGILCRFPFFISLLSKRKMVNISQIIWFGNIARTHFLILVTWPSSRSNDTTHVKIQNQQLGMCLS